MNKSALILAGLQCLMMGHLQLDSFGVDSATRQLTLEVAFEAKSHADPRLHFTLINNSKKEIILPIGSLPWDRYAMTLIIVGVDPLSQPIEEDQIIADPLPGEFQIIRPLERLEKSVALSRRYRDIVKRHKSEDLLVFWSYKCPPLPETERVGGWLFIPRTIQE